MSKCNQNLPLDIFGKNKLTPDGYTYQCKPCRRTYEKQKYIPTSGHLRKQKGELLWCNGCEIYLPPEDFHKQSKAKSGRNSRCMQCVSKAVNYKPREKLPHGMVRCSSCKEIKPLSEYHKDKHRLLGYRSTCKQCISKNPRSPCDQFNRYKKDAMKRELLFTLVPDDFTSLISKPCNYCGSSKSPTINGMGIDRVNNSEGYTLDNSVSCCSICNYMKRCLTENEFKDHIRKLHNHLKL